MLATNRFVRLLSIFALGCCALTSSWGQEINVTGRVVLEGAGNISPATSTVVWLSPVGAGADGAVPVAPMHAVLQQKNKTFEPHLLVVTKGSAVEFPNRDPWFHNVFSLFNGKRFDLGLYEAGSTRTVHFDREGVSYIFCNIHPEMSAVVVVLSSAYFAIPNKQGEFSIVAVLPGRYTLHVWNENALPAALQALSRVVEVSASSRSVGSVRVHVTTASTSHKNKYGQDYEPPSPNSPVYVQPQ
jgi:plastocyanin